MRRIILTLALLFAACNVCPAQTPAKLQTVPAPEVSGAVNIGEDRVILIADEGYDVRIVSHAGQTFRAGDQQSFDSNMKPAIASLTLRDDKSRMDDIEDVAWDKKRNVAYAITSHSLTKNGKEKPVRYKLAQLVFKDGKMDVSTSEVDVLKAALKEKFPFVKDAMVRPTETGGNAGSFNIEGLAFDPVTDSLLIGLRSPTQMSNGNSCAIVLTLKNPDRLFQKDKPAPPEFDSQLRCLDLGGLGIRGMTYDDERKGIWIVAGRSDDPQAATNPQPVLSSLWFWEPAKPCTPPRKAQTDSFGLVNLEGVCLLQLGDKQGLLLISDDGDEKENKVSRYLLIPIPKLPGS